MRTLTIDEIHELEHGEVIPRFTGRIHKINKQLTGEGQWGPWTLQNLLVTEGQLEIPVTWTGEDPFEDTWEGAQVEFACSENNQGKLVGVTRDIRTDKKGVTHRGVKVTTAAKIKRLGAADGASDLITEKPENVKPEKSAAPSPSQSMETAQDWGDLLAEKARGRMEQKPKPNGTSKFEAYAAHSMKIFNIAWKESLVWLATLPEKDAEEMPLERYYDLRMRVAQHIAIEVAKIIRKERF